MKQFYDGIVADGGAAFWFVPQWFSWECYAAERTPGLYRWPSEEEGAAMALLSIMNGANGLIFYSFFDMFKFGDFETQWPRLSRIVGMMNEFAPFALGDEAGMTIKPVSKSGEVVFRSFRSDDGRDAIAIVSPGGSSELALRPAGKWRSTTGRTKVNDDGSLLFSGNGIACDILYRE